MPVSRRRGSSGRWMREHLRDPYVRRARDEGARSRAAYKLSELAERDALFAPGMLVVDLGAAPGGWSAVAARRCGAEGRVIAVDMLPMEPLPGVEFMQGDFTQDGVLAALGRRMGSRLADVVLSDMAPKLSGLPSVDQPRAMHLAELALAFARGHLRLGGTLLVKVFQGEGYQEYLRAMRAACDSMVTRKPVASRARSRECYLLGRGFRPW